MISSQYILDIFELAFDDHSESELLREQVPLLTITETTHTGIGVFINFSFEEPILQFQLETSNSTNLDIDGLPISNINGIQIAIPDISLLADAIIWLKNGVINQLEIFIKNGAEYNWEDPLHYRVEQMWKEKDKCRAIVR